MKHTISRMTITPAENGGVTVEHNYKNEPTVRKGAIHGGFDHGYVEPTTHAFGPKDGKKMMAHMAEHLGMSMHQDEPEEKAPKKMSKASKEERESGL
jgi:hypothetical protein